MGWQDESYGGLWAQVYATEVEIDSIVPAYLQLAAVVRWHIIEWQLPVGAQLPTESQLAELFDIGRDTVRAGLAILRQTGMITTRRGSGTTVKFRPELQLVKVPAGARVTASLWRTDSPQARSVDPSGRALFTPILTVEEPGKEPAYYDSTTTAIELA